MRKKIFTFLLALAASVGMSWAAMQPIGPNVVYKVGDVIRTTSNVYLAMDYAGNNLLLMQETPLTLEALNPGTPKASIKFEQAVRKYSNPTGDPLGFFDWVYTSNACQSAFNYVRVSGGDGSFENPYTFEACITDPDPSPYPAGTIITWDPTFCGTPNKACYNGSQIIHNNNEHVDGIKVEFSVTNPDSRSQGFMPAGIQLLAGTGAQLTFTSTVGNISQIIIYYDLWDVPLSLPEGWTEIGYHRLSWNGTPASSVALPAPQNADLFIAINQLDFFMGGSTPTPTPTPDPDPSGLQVTEITSDLYAGWQSNSDPFTVDALPGFQAVTLEEAAAWTGVPNSGYAILVYAAAGDGVSIVAFNNGIHMSNGNIEVDLNQVYQNVAEYGQRYFYTGSNGGSTPTPEPEPQQAGPIPCTAADRGKVLCTDGSIYATVSDATAASKTAAAVIAYVDTENGKGLALALANESGTMDWETAKTTAAAHTPAVSGGTWTLASKVDWDNMINAAGGYNALRDGFSGVGGTNIEKGQYWTSTEYDSGMSLVLNFGTNDGGYFVGGNEDPFSVRACLAFEISAAPAPAEDVNITPNVDPENPTFYYSTFFDSSVKYELPENVEAYVADLSGANLLLTKIAEAGEVIPANVAVILKSTVTPFTLTVSDADAVTFTANNDLLGVDAETAITSIDGLTTTNCYVLSGTNEYGVGFYRINSDNLKAHKAYVKYAGLQNNAPRRMRFVFNQEQVATGIDNANADIKAEKRIENGQLVIIRDGVRYNVFGAKIQ